MVWQLAGDKINGFYFWNKVDNIIQKILYMPKRQTKHPYIDNDINHLMITLQNLFVNWKLYEFRWGTYNMMSN